MTVQSARLACVSAWRSFFLQVHHDILRCSAQTAASSVAYSFILGEAIKRNQSIPHNSHDELLVQAEDKRDIAQGVVLKTQIYCRNSISMVSIHPYSRTHFLGFFFTTGFKTARTASANTSLTPSWCKAEHSRYFTAPICLARDEPCWVVVGARLCSFNFLIVSASFRRSLLVPTSKTGTLGQ